jgi:hypothetical protein
VDAFELFAAGKETLDTGRTAGVGIAATIGSAADEFGRNGSVGGLAACVVELCGSDVAFCTGVAEV